MEATRDGGPYSATESCRSKESHRVTATGRKRLLGTTPRGSLGQVLELLNLNILMCKMGLCGF